MPVYECCLLTVEEAAYFHIGNRKLYEIIVILGLCGIYTLTTSRKLVLGIVVIGVFHEWEEKRIPGGFQFVVILTLKCSVQSS